MKLLYLNEGWFISRNQRRRKNFFFDLVLFIIQRLFDHHPKNDHFSSMGILLVRCNNDHRRYLVHHQVINDDIVLIICYPLLHPVTVRNTVRLPMILVEVGVKLVLVHRVSPNDHHRLQVQFLGFSSSFSMSQWLDSRGRFNPTAYIRERNVKLRQIEIQK